MTTASGYHSGTNLTRPLANDLMDYDDFELERRSWSLDRLLSWLAHEESVSPEIMDSSVAFIGSLLDELKRELDRPYRRSSHLRDESNRAYQGLEPRVQAVKDRLTIQEYVEAVSPRTRLSRRGDNLVGSCPYHVEKTPSFYIFPDGGAHCFGCQMGGDLFDVIGLIEGLDRFYDQLRHAEMFLGITPAIIAGPANGTVRSQGAKTFTPIRIGSNGRVVS